MLYLRLSLLGIALLCLLCAISVARGQEAPRMALIIPIQGLVCATEDDATKMAKSIGTKDEAATLIGLTASGVCLTTPDGFQAYAIVVKSGFSNGKWHVVGVAPKPDQPPNLWMILKLAPSI